MVLQRKCPRRWTGCVAEGQRAGLGWLAKGEELPHPSWARALLIADPGEAEEGGVKALALGCGERGPGVPGTLLNICLGEFLARAVLPWSLIWGCVYKPEDKRLVQWEREEWTQPMARGDMRRKDGQ